MQPRVRTTQAPGGTYRLGHGEVARIGYGAIQLRRYQAEPAKAEALLRRALELGVDHIDTAQFYGNGFANQMIHKVAPSKNDLVIATKVGADPELNGNIPVKLAQRPEQLRASLEANLLSLGMERASRWSTCAGLTWAPGFRPKATRSLRSMIRSRR